MPKLVIGLVGPIASGKGTVIKILKERGFTAYSTSDVLKEEVKKRGLEVTRSNCNLVSNELRETHGADVLARQTGEIIERNNPDYVVVDAIRNPAEVSYLKQNFGAKIIGVVADQKARYVFFVERGTFLGEIDTFEKFKELDDREMQQEGKHKQQTKACLELADIVIENNGTVEVLKKKVDEFVRSVQ